MSEWQEVTLQDVVSILGDGLHGTPIYDDNGEYYFVNGNNLSNGKILLKESTRRTSKEEYLKYKKPLNDRTILLSINGTLGNVALYNNEKCFLGKSACYFNVKESVDKQFIRYVVTNKYFQTYITEFAHGTTIQNLSLKTLREFPFELPPLSEQKAIASVLSSLDDKIDLLHRQNTTLERMAKTLFRQWFVEEAQESWEEVTLSSLCTLITKGTTPTTLGHSFVESGINFIKAESITDAGGFITEKFAKISSETHAFLKRSIIQKSDVLCSIAGTIGRVAIVEDSILPANINQAIAILRVDESKCFPEFIYLFLKSDYFQEVMDGKIVHAVQPNLSLGEIGNTTLKIAPFEKLIEFRNLVKSIFDKKTNNLLQIQTLEKLRDNLLPKLMSGEVKVTYEH